MVFEIWENKKNKKHLRNTKEKQRNTKKNKGLPRTRVQFLEENTNAIVKVGRGVPADVSSPTWPPACTPHGNAWKKKDWKYISNCDACLDRLLVDYTCQLCRPHRPTSAKTRWQDGPRFWFRLWIDFCFQHRPWKRNNNLFFIIVQYFLKLPRIFHPSPSLVPTWPNVAPSKHQYKSVPKPIPKNINILTDTRIESFWLHLGSRVWGKHRLEDMIKKTMHILCVFCGWVWPGWPEDRWSDFFAILVPFFFPSFLQCLAGAIFGGSSTQLGLNIDQRRSKIGAKTHPNLGSNFGKTFPPNLDLRWQTKHN